MSNLTVIGEGGEELFITPSTFNAHPIIRKMVFRLARNESPEAISFLWDNFKCREITQKEIDEFNSKKNGGSH
jgi:hypothetical protein